MYTVDIHSGPGEFYDFQSSKTGVNRRLQSVSEVRRVHLFFLWQDLSIDFLPIRQSNVITKTCSVSAQPSLHRYIIEKCAPSVTFFVTTEISVPTKP